MAAMFGAYHRLGIGMRYCGRELDVGREIVQGRQIWAGESGDAGPHSYGLDCSVSDGYPAPIV